MEVFLFKESQISAEKIAAYRATDYQFFQDGYDIGLRIDKACGALIHLFKKFSCESGFLITAYNPYGALQSEEENESAHIRLGIDLQKNYSIVLDALGSDPIGDWPSEKSYFVLGGSLADAQLIGNRYSQDAFVWVGEDAIPRLILLR